MTVQQISVFLENKPGTLAEFTSLLEKNNIDLHALSLAEHEDFGIVRVIVNEVYKTINMLRDEGYVCSMTPVIAVEVEDKPGALVRILDTLGKAKVNLEYSYAFLARRANCAFLILQTAANDQASRVLSAAGIKPVTQEDLESKFS